MKKRKGFSLIGALIFIVIVSLCVGVISYMIGSIDYSGYKPAMLSIAESLAEGRMDYIQGLPFSSVASVARASVGGSFTQFDSEIISQYVNGPSDLDTVVGGPTNYKKVTVIIYHADLSNTQLVCIKVART